MSKIEENKTVTKTTSNTTSIEDFILPDIGEGITECEVVEWLITEGEHIEEDQPVCDIMTDKALVQIPSKFSGKVIHKYYKTGDVAKVHTPLFSMEIDSSLSKKSINIDSIESTPLSTSNQNIDIEINNRPKVISSPSVRRLAREMSIDLIKVPGSGENGRIFKEDIIAFKNEKNCLNKVIRKKNITGIMAKMAIHMSEAVQTIPHFTFCEEIDVTELVVLKDSLKDNYKTMGINLTIMPFFIKTLSLALKAFPQINVQTNDLCTELTYFDDHNIGIAVNSKMGLLVPNIKQCQNKSINKIAEELTQLTHLAKIGKISQNSLRNGTITISNIGVYGGTVATPIINKPEAAIVALGRIQKLPRFNEKDEVQARKVMQVSWSADHRIIDGATITFFNNKWKEYLENPNSMIPELI